MTTPKRLNYVSAIFAVDENLVLGKGNTIPWHSPQDFKWFQETTTHHSVAMGRKTWESLPKKPLPKRSNYVITSDPNYIAVGAVVCSSLQEAIELSQKEDPSRHIFIIGGKSLLEESFEIAKRVYISHIGVKTPVDDTCVMGPTMPIYPRQVMYNRIFEGDSVYPRVTVETNTFME